jgi:hypothetical protein
MDEFPSSFGVLTDDHIDWSSGGPLAGNSRGR